MTSKVTNDPVMATYSLTVGTTRPGDQETMTKTMASSHRTGQPVNHHHANSVIMIGTIATHHTTPRHEHKATMTMMSSCHTEELVNNYHSHIVSPRPAQWLRRTPCLGVREKASMTMPRRAYRSEDKTGWRTLHLYM